MLKNNILTSPYKAVIFDMDGTLLNTLPDLADAGNHTLAALKLKTYAEDDYRHFIGDGLPVLIKRIMPQNSTDCELMNAFEIFSGYYNMNMFNKTTVYPGLTELLHELLRFGIKTGIITNKPHDFACELTKRYLNNLICVTLGAREGVPKKPSPCSLLEMTRHFGVKADEVLYIGDSGTDMLTAKNAGTHSCGVRWGFRERSELIENEADFLVQTTEELRNVIFSS